MFNRSRIISQVNRGLAQPMLWWFPPSNQFYNPNLRLQWTYDKDRALQLLSSIGINRDSQGVMRDWEGREVAFDLSFPSGQGTWDDMAAIITDELGSIGITVRPLPTDFQRLVDQLFETFDWQSVMIGITGGPTFPTQGTNVWLSNGNLHLWHPFQKDETRTEWEARKDFLFREGMFTYDVEKARPIWDEFQEILLREVPLIWMGRLHGFFAVQNRWDQSNVYYDNVRASDTTHAFLSK
jgi:peptide/nickel transport system substrate-binding protein